MKDFFKFIGDKHPCFKDVANASKRTIISDQDKGLINAVNAHLPLPAHLHCSKHRGDKLMGETKKVFHRLIRAESVTEANNIFDSAAKELPPCEIEKLNWGAKSKFYPVFRVANNPGARMDSRSASQMVEAMNNANSQARKKAAIDPFHASIKLLYLERARYAEHKRQAERRTHFLSNAAAEHLEELSKYAELHKHGFFIEPHNHAEADNVVRFTVNEGPAVQREYDKRIRFTVKLPLLSPGMARDQYDRLNPDCQFGECSCGRTSVTGIPCEHIAVVCLKMHTKTPRIPDLQLLFADEWTTTRWREQYAAPVPDMLTTDAVKEDPGTVPDNNLLPPDSAAPQKRGRPKKEKRHLHPRETRTNETKRVRKCSSCGERGHNRANCPSMNFPDQHLPVV